MLKKFFLATILAVTMALFTTNVNECYARSINEPLQKKFCQGISGI